MGFEGIQISDQLDLERCGPLATRLLIGLKRSLIGVEWCKPHHCICDVQLNSTRSSKVLDD